MKNLVTALLFVLFVSLTPRLFPPGPEPSEAATFVSGCVDRSSYTAVTATTARLPNSGPGSILYSVIVSSRGGDGAEFTLYDSSGTAGTGAKNLGVYEADTNFQYDFSLRISSAVTYTSKAGASTLAPALMFLWCGEGGDLGD